MLTTNQTSNHQPLSAWRGAVVVLAISGVMIVLRLVGVENMVAQLLAPISRTCRVSGNQVARLILSPYWIVVTSFNSAVKIQQLERQYATTLARLGEAEALRRENEQLKQALSDNRTTQGVRLWAYPISSYAAQLIDVGRSEGVQIGTPVLVESIVVGRVSSLSDHQAEVKVMDQVSEEKLVAAIDGQVVGLISGDGKRILITEVAHDFKLESGQLVTTAGQPGVPPNLVVGTVGELISEIGAAVQTAVVDQPISFYQTSLVEVQL